MIHNETRRFFERLAGGLAPLEDHQVFSISLCSHPAYIKNNPALRTALLPHNMMKTDLDLNSSETKKKISWQGRPLRALP